MNPSDDLEAEFPELPVEAGRQTPTGFEPNDTWFATAPSHLRREVMRRWFFTHYCDPVNDTPFDSEEGGYLYIHGGPYMAEEELYDRFGKLSSDQEISEVIVEVESEGTDEWAPIHYDDRDDEYEYRFALELKERSEPIAKLRERLRQSLQLLTLQGDADTKDLANKLVFGSLISALETYLYETAHFWIDTDEEALHGLVAGLPAFREEKLSLADIFTRHEGIKAHVKGYLQNTIWHRFDKVAPIFKYALSVKLPSTEMFLTPLDKRHDIVHRSGHDKSGTAITVTEGEILQLSRNIEEFAAELNLRIEQREIHKDDLSVTE